MKKVLLCVVAMLLLASPAMALPSWWNSYQFKAALEGTLENTGGGSASGTVDVVVENSPSPVRYKELYVVFDWNVISDQGAPAMFLDTVILTWPGGGPVNLNPVVSSDPLPNHHREYAYTITPQPPFEALKFQWQGLDVVGDMLHYTYDIRTICFDIPNGPVPEPGVLMLVAGGLVGLVVRKRR